MKIVPKAVESFLSAPQRECKAALIYGVDNGIVRERAEKIIKAVLGTDANDPLAKSELYEAEILADSVRLADELSAVNMLCSKRIIVIRDAGDKLTKIIDSAAQFFHKDNFLLVISDELSAKSSLRAFFEKNDSCASVACYRDEARDIGTIIRQKFAEAKVVCEQGVVEYLVSQLGNDRYVTYQELEKLVVFAGDEKKLYLSDTQKLVDYNQETQLDDVINSVADKNIAALEKNLTQHLREGTQPILYLRSLQKYFNRLYFINTQIKQNNQSAEMVIAGLRPAVHFKQKDNLIRHARSWNTENTVKALRLLITAELQCKSSDIPAIPASSRELFKVTQLR